MNREQNDYALEITSLLKQYGDQKAVDEISFKVKRGEIFAILGPNGAGKTTLIKMLSTLLKPDSGSAKVFGCDIEKEQEKVRKNISLTGQNTALDEQLTARQNLMMFSQLIGLKKKDARKKADTLLQEFSLYDAADKLVSQFSGGMKRRLDLAVSLITRPNLLFLDEPTTGLDPRTRVQIWDTLKKMVAEGTTLILTTQYLEEAEQLADRILIMDKGRISAIGTPDELKKKTGPIQFQYSMKDKECLEVAQKINQRVCGIQGHYEEKQNLVIVPVTDDSMVQKLLTELNDADIRVVEMSMKKPSMDDVFLATTQEDEQARNQTETRRMPTWGRPIR